MVNYLSQAVCFKLHVRVCEGILVCVWFESLLSASVLDNVMHGLIISLSDFHADYFINKVSHI